MTEAKLSEPDFIRQFESIGPRKMARQSGLTLSGLYKRRVRIEKRLGRQLTPPPDPRNTRRNIAHPQRIDVDIKDGVVLVGSDAHYWPGDPSIAHQAFIKFCKETNPGTVVMNGDVMDGARISRFPPIGWETQPTVAEEIGAAQRRMREITDATPNASHIWPLGNHDGRMETRLATVAPEFAGVHGVHLKDHFPDWEACWSVFINDDVVVKHRFKGGDHATWNNVIKAGRTMITGHLHSLQVRPFTDYNGTRWGVDTGCLADIYGKQFTDYTEDNPRNWRSGFIILTFKDGELLDPEIVRVWDDKRVVFRGELIDV